MQGDAVVRPQRAGVDAEPFPQTCLERKRQRSMDASAEWRVQANAPVTDLVAEALHHEVAVVGHYPGRGRLVVEIREQVLDRQVVESGAVAPPLRGGGRIKRTQLAHHLAQRRTQLDWAARGVGPPEGDLPRLAPGGTGRQPR